MKAHLSGKLGESDGQKICLKAFGGLFTITPIGQPNVALR
jgi:hypothetical protein